MAQTISTLNFLITGESEDLLRDLDNVADRMWVLGSRIEQTGEKASVFARLTDKRVSGALLEASRGLEDFTVVLAGGGGLGGAFRATANNISQMAARIHPLAGAFAGLAVAIGVSVIPALYRFITGAEEAERRLKELQKNLEKGLTAALDQTADAAGRAGEALSFKRMVESADDLGSANKMLTEQQDALAAANAAMAVYSDTIRRATEEGERLQNVVMASRIGGSVNKEDEARLQAQIEYIDELTKAYNEQASAAEKASRAARAIKDRLPDLQAEEQRKAAMESIAIESKRLEQFKSLSKKRAEERAQLETEIFADSDPLGGQIAAIESTLRQREGDIARLFAGDPEKIAELTRQSYTAALDELNALAQDDAKKNAQRRDLGGPVAALRESQEAFSLIQRAVRRGRDPGEETAENTAEANERLLRIQTAIETLSKDGAEFVRVSI